VALEASQEPPGHDLPRAWRQRRLREEELLELRTGEETVEREKPYDVGLAAARGDHWLFSDERTKDLSNEKKLSSVWLRTLAQDPNQIVGRPVGRDQRRPNGSTNATRELTVTVYR
jgi:hypothetical protein